MAIKFKEQVIGDSVQRLITCSDGESDKFTDSRYKIDKMLSVRNIKISELR